MVLESTQRGIMAVWGGGMKETNGGPSGYTHSFQATSLYIEEDLQTDSPKIRTFSLHNLS